MLQYERKEAPMMSILVFALRAGRGFIPTYLSQEVEKFFIMQERMVFPLAVLYPALLSNFAITDAVAWPQASHAELPFSDDLHALFHRLLFELLAVVEVVVPPAGRADRRRPLAFAVRFLWSCGCVNEVRFGGRVT